MSEQHSREPDRIDELLGSLQESRTAQCSCWSFCASRPAAPS